MSTPVVKHRGRGSITEVNSATNSRGKATNGVAVVLQPSDPCPRCGDKGHLMSDHVVEKANSCQKCACIAQDTDSA